MSVDAALTEEDFYRSLHEAAHVAVGRHLGMRTERIIIRGESGNRVFFTDVRDYASMIVVCYAVGVMERKAGGTVQRNTEDLEKIEELAATAGFEEHHLPAFERTARRLCNLLEREIYDLCYRLTARGVYRFRGERLVYVGGIR